MTACCQHLYKNVKLLRVKMFNSSLSMHLLAHVFSFPVYSVKKKKTKSAAILKNTDLPGIRVTRQPVASRRLFPQCDSRASSVHKRFVVWLTKLCLVFCSLSSLEPLVNRLEIHRIDQWDTTKKKTQQYITTGEPRSVIVCWEQWNVVLLIRVQRHFRYAWQLEDMVYVLQFDWHQAEDALSCLADRRGRSPEVGRWFTAADAGERALILLPNHIYAAAVAVRGRPAEAREH